MRLAKLAIRPDSPSETWKKIPRLMMVRRTTGTKIVQAAEMGFLKTRMWKWAYSKLRILFKLSSSSSPFYSAMLISFDF